MIQPNINGLQTFILYEQVLFLNSTRAHFRMDILDIWYMSTDKYMTYVHIVLYDFEAPRTIKKLPFKPWVHTVKVISNRFSVSLMNPLTIIVTFYRSLKEHVRSPLTHCPLAAHSFNTVSPTIYAPKHFCLMIENRGQSPPPPPHHPRPQWHHISNGCVK